MEYPMIRCTTRNSFRQGEWARIVGVESFYPMLDCIAQPGRVCFLVEFLDGRQDRWSCEAAAAGYEYEFMPSLTVS